MVFRCAQNKIIKKFTDSVKDLVDTPKLLSEVINFAEENLNNNKKPIEKEKKDKQKENTEKTIGLLNTVYHKVAMGNAHPELLKVANHVTDSIYDKGVLTFLKSYFNKK